MNMVLWGWHVLLAAVFLLPGPQRTTLGQAHLHVRDVLEANRFYHDLLGFDVLGLSESMGASLAPLADSPPPA